MNKEKYKLTKVSLYFGIACINLGLIIYLSTNEFDLLFCELFLTIIITAFIYILERS